MFKLLEIDALQSLPNIVKILSNLSRLHQTHIIDKDKSVDLAILAIVLGLSKLNDMKFLMDDLQKVRNVLHNWKMTDEEIEQLIEDYKNQKT